MVGAYPKPYFPPGLACCVYWIFVWDPRTDYRTVTLGYIGETSRADARARLAEHIEDQPWGDTLIDPADDEAYAQLVAYLKRQRWGRDILDVITRIPRRELPMGAFVFTGHDYRDKAEAYQAEQAAIGFYRPLYNDEYNRGNPDRIEIWKAREQRRQREGAQGVPQDQRWTPPKERTPAPGVVRRTRRRWAPRRLSPANERRAAVAVIWTATTGGLWWAGTRFAPFMSTLRLGGLAALLVTLVAVFASRPKRRTWRRLGNTLTCYVILAAAAWLVYPSAHDLTRALIATIIGTPSPR